MGEGPPVLFDFIGPPPAHRLGRRPALDWLARKKRHFSFFVFLSFVAHLALFGMMVILGPRAEAPSSPAAVRGKDLQAFKGALREYAADGRTPERLANALLALTEEEIEEAFRQAPVLDYRLSDREKAGWYEQLFREASAEFTAVTGEGRSVPEPPLSRYFGRLKDMPVRDPGEDHTLVRIDDALGESARLFKLSKERAETLGSLVLPDDGSKDRAAEVGLLNEEGWLLNVPGEYFYRDSPYLEIAAAGAGLFFIIKGFPELPAAGAGDGPGRAHPAKVPAAPRETGSPVPPSPAFSVVLVARGVPRDQASGPAAARPRLTLTKREIDRVLDGLMALPLADQVRAFHRDYLESYDPDSPDLARLTGEFLYRNLGMIFVRAGGPLARGFDLLEEVYYDNLSFDALVPYALEHRRSRTGAEILLGLAASYEFERRAIVALDGAFDAAKTVLADPSEERFFVHNKSAKAYVVREVYRDLVAELHGRGYPTLETVLQKYRDEQLGIYDLLIGMGGEAKCRALYALGRLYWDEGQTKLAMEIWKATDPAFADETLTWIRGVIIEGRRLTDRVASIDDILGRRAAGERSVQLARIAKFHKWDRR
jgi:hypothetical protein